MKVGDRVICTHANPIVINRIGIVLTYDTNTFQVVWEDGGSDNTKWSSDCDFKVITEKRIPTKVGDKVRCVYPCDRKDKIATITNIKSDRQFEVSWEDGYGGSMSWTYFSSFELVEENKESSLPEQESPQPVQETKEETIASFCKKKYYGIDCSCPLCSGKTLAGDICGTYPPPTVAQVVNNRNNLC